MCCLFWCSVIWDVVESFLGSRFEPRGISLRLDLQSVRQISAIAVALACSLKP